MNAADLSRVSLHEHLDGSLRAETLLDLARQAGVRTPADNAADLRTYLRDAVHGSLANYLACFELTVSVLQTEDALERAAYEHAEQLSLDGCDRAEIRFAPQLHAPGAATSIQAVLAGLERARRDGLCDTTLIVCAIRESDPITTETIACAAVDTPGVVGFDLAGMEAGNPPQNHDAALRLVREAGLGLTIHAGEADGPVSIAAAVAAGATRLGHGVRVFDDISRGPRGPLLGRIAAEVLDKGIHLEVCVSSNLDTGIYPDAASHPVMTLKRIGFSVSLSTDNRLMSATTLEAEEQLCRSHLYASAREIVEMRDAARLALFPRR
jgi:adenosine deaminase